MTTNFFSPLSFVAVWDPGSEIRDPGSGMGKNQDLGSGINIPRNTGQRGILCGNYYRWILSVNSKHLLI
jgi:hypothetical protein